MSHLSYLILPWIGVIIGFLISVLGGGGGIFYVGISGTPPILAGLYLMFYPAIKVIGTSTIVLAVIAL